MTAETTPENFQWIIEVIDELREFAQDNNLPAFDAQLELLAETVRSEVPHSQKIQTDLQVLQEKLAG
ncbi:hypothetical protein [uncultured Roseobacter sp.]|uniref:hypothetical protein n=1 Tax=uncultured Roseobacter sp. TaxID=114847 RepID=UPI00260E1F7A|nr:hypothetical protein [uncultured Roseobacter sp.]